MGEKTGIGWTDHTFNPVWGCFEVGPGCDHCYARVWAERMGLDVWGVDKPLREFGDKHWNEPLKWNRKAEKDGERRKVFCASMADVFDKRWPASIRPRLWDLIEKTPWLDWQLLTKRIGNAVEMVPNHWSRDGWPANVWLVPTMVNQAEFDRDMPKLAYIPAAVRGVSYEPAIGPLTLGKWARYLDWLIIGGESYQAGHAREFLLKWARDLLRECPTNVAVYVKQLGALPIGSAGDDIRLAGMRDRRAGAIPGEWPEDLRRREFPFNGRKPPQRNYATP